MPLISMTLSTSSYDRIAQRSVAWRRLLSNQAVVVTIVVLLLGISASLGNMHRLHDSDSYIPVLVSLQRWTPFYWGQDRFGMFPALLALPVSNPLYNLLVQSFFYATCGFAALFLMCRFATRNASGYLAGTVATIVFLLSVPTGIHFGLFGTVFPYGVSLAFGFAGLLLARDGRSYMSVPCAAIAYSLASWSNSSIFVILIPTFLVDLSVRWSTWQKHGRFLRLHLAMATVALLLGCAFGPLLGSLAGSGYNYPTLPWREWPASWLHLMENSAKADLSTTFLAVSGAFFVVACLHIASVHHRPAAWEEMRSSLTLLVPGVISALAIGTLSHVKMNNWDYRYWIPSVVLCGCGFVTPLVSKVATNLSCSVLQRTRVVMVASLFLAALAVFDPGTVANVRGMLEKHSGSLAKDIVAEECTHVAGDYWTVWPAVFFANLLRYEQGRSDQIFGIAPRSEKTTLLWRKWDPARFRVAIDPLDPLALRALQHSELPQGLSLHRRLPKILVLRMTPDGRPIRTKEVGRVRHDTRIEFAQGDQ